MFSLKKITVRFFLLVGVLASRGLQGSQTENVSQGLSIISPDQPSLEQISAFRQLNELKAARMGTNFWIALFFDLQDQVMFFADRCLKLQEKMINSEHLKAIEEATAGDLRMAMSIKGQMEGKIKNQIKSTLAQAQSYEDSLVTRVADLLTAKRGNDEMLKGTKFHLDTLRDKFSLSMNRALMMELDKKINKFELLEAQIEFIRVFNRFRFHASQLFGTSFDFYSSEKFIIFGEDESVELLSFIKRCAKIQKSATGVALDDGQPQGIRDVMARDARCGIEQLGGSEAVGRYKEMQPAIQSSYKIFYCGAVDDQAQKCKTMQQANSVRRINLLSYNYLDEQRIPIPRELHDFSQKILAVQIPEIDPSLLEEEPRLKAPSAAKSKKKGKKGQASQSAQVVLGAVQASCHSKSDDSADQLSSHSKTVVDESNAIKAVKNDIQILDELNNATITLFNWADILNPQKHKFVWAQRLHDWFAKPENVLFREGYRNFDHKNLTPELGLVEAVIRHTFPKEVDNYLRYLGIDNCIPGMIEYSVAQEVNGIKETKKKVLLGVFSYAFDAAGVCYHRCFQETKTRNQMLRGIIQDQWDNLVKNEYDIEYEELADTTPKQIT